MAHHYHIQKYDSGDLSALIFSTNFDSPMNNLGSVEIELHNNGVKGQVFFDLLLSNGNTSDRYYSAFFDGVKLIEDSIKKVVKPPQDIQEKSRSFYYKRPHILKNSVLNKTQRFLVKKNHLLVSRG